MLNYLLTWQEILTLQKKRWILLWYKTHSPSQYRNAFSGLSLHLPRLTLFKCFTISSRQLCPNVKPFAAWCNVPQLLFSLVHTCICDIRALTPHSPPPPPLPPPALSPPAFLSPPFLCCRPFFSLNHTGPSNSDHLWLSGSESAGLVLESCTKINLSFRFSCCPLTEMKLPMLLLLYVTLLCPSC